MRSAHPRVDMIYHTGDMVDHGIWETTEAGNRAIMDRIFNMFREVFGASVPVYSCIGNHEGREPKSSHFDPSLICASFQLNRPTCKNLQKHLILSPISAINFINLFSSPVSLRLPSPAHPYRRHGCTIIWVSKSENDSTDWKNRFCCQLTPGSAMDGFRPRRLQLSVRVATIPSLCNPACV